MLIRLGYGPVAPENMVAPEYIGEGIIRIRRNPLSLHFFRMHAGIPVALLEKVSPAEMRQ
jgi:hypothetical protein